MRLLCAELEILRVDIAPADDDQIPSRPVTNSSLSEEARSPVRRKERPGRLGTFAPKPVSTPPGEPQ
jgi:hypothetical protein